MGVFTVLAEADLIGIAAAFGLGDVRGFRAIAAGTINSNYELVTSRATFFVRVNEGKSEADVGWEARLVTALAQGGVITPPPLPALDQKPYAPLAQGTSRKWVSVFPWRDGSHLAPEAITPELATKFGAALAQLHHVGLSLPAGWRRGSIYDHDHLVARYARFERNDDRGLTDAIRILGEELGKIADATHLRRRATHGIIHGDLFRDNVLWDAGEISAILDFEQASGGSLVYDLGVCINDWCWDGAPRVDLAHALVAGYQTVRALTDADRGALPIEIRAAAARFTITRITDVYLARVPNPDKDFRAFLARCEAWRGPSLGQLTSAV
ncbi:MAG: hypothetical protein JWO36_7284 [Myxococcales bacterium]|nr:hypothetical protein [Myxococcales bacterium]